MGLVHSSGIKSSIGQFNGAAWLACISLDEFDIELCTMIHGTKDNITAHRREIYISLAPNTTMAVLQASHITVAKYSSLPTRLRVYRSLHQQA